MGRYIHNLISGGEGLNLDFKYCISDPQKIARTLSAFSNTAGGKLLIGVRDNGSLAGVRSDEEYYMIDAAARLHCDPEVTIRTRNHTVNGKNILEVEVPKSNIIPVKARDEHGRWKAYFRQNDQNFMADRVILQVWRRSVKSRGLLLRFEETENLLLNHLRSEGRITVEEFRNLTGINARRAEKILSDFILCGLITYEASERGIFYRLSTEFGSGR
ncbi:MAG: ATP-binding protein [Bacteroidales bacterium]|jgi:predicted HTH transcriptional regulator|nr:ATP-binding protein [Bacteroidales bacterium]HNX83132.1 ATP-binding protein [Bacteroidales bacterium]HOC47647.1 ATP-binding protein [Bacteroidales bacterium]HPS98463.1 ATP-binding protein [Bacteroidales bacterium]